jgi:hypothetical protein
MLLLLLLDMLLLLLDLLLLLQILPVVLGVRQYSARIEMFRQLTKQLHPAAEVRHNVIQAYSNACSDSKALQQQQGIAATAGQAVWQVVLPSYSVS